MTTKKMLVGYNWKKGLEHGKAQGIGKIIRLRSGKNDEQIRFEKVTFPKSVDQCKNLP